MQDALGRELNVGDPVIYWSYSQQIFELLYIGNQSLLVLQGPEYDNRVVVRSRVSMNFLVEMNSVWLITPEEATLWILRE